jgi:hypothetical protein
MPAMSKPAGYAPHALLAAALWVAVAPATVRAQGVVAGLTVTQHARPFADGELVDITVSAWFDDDLYDMVGGVIFDATLGGVMPGDTMFFSPLVDLHEPRRLVFVPPATYRNIYAGQLHFPPIGAFGDQSNPLPIASFEFFTHDTTRRELPFEVPLIFAFSVYPDVSSPESTQLEAGQFPSSLSFIVRVGESCRGDFDADGELTIFDFLAFQNAFDAGDPAANYDGDDALTLFDFLAFQNAFDAGCP